jgi:hypothetical protein
MWRKGLLFARGLVCAAGVFAMWLSSGSLAAEAPQIKMSIRGASPEGIRPDFAHAVQRGKKWVVVINGVEGKEYDEIARGPLVLHSQRFGTSFVLPGESAESGLVFSPDGKRVAYAARNGTRWVVVVDGVEGKEMDAFSRYGSIGKEEILPVFSPDSKRVAHVAKRAGKCVVVVDGEEGKEYEGARAPVFSPDSKRVAYWACLGGKLIPKWVVVVDGVEGKEYGLVSDTTQMVTSPPLFSPNSQCVAYHAQRGGKPLIVVDGVETKQYCGIVRDTLTFSPDSKHVAYGACLGGEWRRKWGVVVDGVEGKDYEGIGEESLIFSPDSKRMAYAAARGGKGFVVVDGVEREEGGAIGRGALLFSPDGQRMAYVARRGKKFWAVVVDGVEGKEYEGVTAGTPVFSPDSKHVVYGALAGDKFLFVVDGVEVQATEFAGILTVNGTALVFDSPTQFHAYALGGKRVDVEISGSAGGTATSAPK